MKTFFLTELLVAANHRCDIVKLFTNFFAKLATVILHKNNPEICTKQRSEKSGKKVAEKVLTD